MHIVPIHQAKNQFSALLHAVERGEEVVLTRHGKWVARITAEPAHDRDSASQVLSLEARAAREQEAMAAMEAVRAQVRPGPPVDWKALRDAGRRF